MAALRKRDLIGRKIVEVDLNRGREGSPTLTLDNGRRLYFVVHELRGDYSIETCLTRKPTK